MMPSSAGPLRLQAFVPAQATRDDWRAFHRFHRAIQQEARPDDPVTPEDEMERQLTAADAFTERRFFGLWLDGTLVSGFSAFWARPAAPDYDTRRHLIFAGANVLPDFRRRGIGRQWLPVLLQLARECGATTVTCSTEEPAGHAFLASMGAELKMQMTENRLDLHAVDWALVTRWADAGRSRSPGVALERHDGGAPEPMWNEMSRVYTEIANDQPFDALDTGAFRITPESIREDYARQQRSGALLHTFVTREPDGALSAYTELCRTPSRPALVAQRGTGVLYRYRQRGLGKWLKAEALTMVRRTYPDARWIVTGNATTNAAMRAINERLGFTPYKTSGTYQLGVAALEASVTLRADARALHETTR